MRYEACCAVSVQLLCALGLTVLAGCGNSENQHFTRIHLSNERDTAVVFLAIEDSEMAATSASNRLARPLMPQAVYSAVLAHPGNYWVRTETERGGSTVRRIEGPIRIERGVRLWELKRDDEKPLYQKSATGMALPLVPQRR